MALAVKWSKEAKATYEDVLIYLKENWSDKEIINSLIKQSPFCWQFHVNRIFLKHPGIKNSEKQF